MLFINFLYVEISYFIGRRISEVGIMSAAGLKGIQKPVKTYFPIFLVAFSILCIGVIMLFFYLFLCNNESKILIYLFCV